jgi:rRNA-processing protein FCF1
MKQEQLKRKLRIYIDTSIIGGFFDKEFIVETKALFQRLENKEVIFVISDLLAKELEKAKREDKRNLLLNYDNDCFEYVELTEEAKTLADCYITEGIVGIKHKDDCQHIAIATVNKVDILASFNFKHIVNYDKIRLYNSVNLRQGYSTIEIRDPKHLINL